MNRTKAEMLEWMAPQVNKSRVLPLCHFPVRDWKADRGDVLQHLRRQAFASGPMIVRSSAVGEDSEMASQAGQFASVANVSGERALGNAIDEVVASYGTGDHDHLVLVQPMLDGVVASGVAFSCDPSSGAPYRVINWHDGADTAAVTGGQGEALRTFYGWRGAGHVPDTAPSWLLAVLDMISEVEALLDSSAIDIEFAVTSEGLPVLFQARPLVMTADTAASLDIQVRALKGIAKAIATGQKPNPYLHGERTVYGIMPDWNPAEIIGVKPRPLALSLYQDLVTNSIWAYQRDNYGYRNLRSFPLLKSFHGLPYIDVRVSFNSFVPADVDGNLADRLVNEYIDRLIAAPALHDKVEFEIVLSCYSFDLPERLAALPDGRFDDTDRETLAASLRRLTNKVINRDKGLWQKDLDRIAELTRRRNQIMAADMDTVSRIYWLLEDCKRYGTLPFAGLARAGFIATQILRSLKARGILSNEELASFMTGVDSISARMGRDLGDLSREAFLVEYGHLRPGTYDILSPRYDEAPDTYFDWSGGASGEHPIPAAFALSLTQLRAIEALLAEHGLEQSVVGLFDFLESAIRGREYSKFIFTRSLSDAMALFAHLGEEHGFKADDMSYAQIGCIARLYGGSEDPHDVLAASIAEGRSAFNLTRQINLPPLITSPQDVWGFETLACEPNYITQKEASGRVAAPDPNADLTGAIVVLPNADPGFDWIFSRRIAGFVTAYGGVNSHMAVRAGELSLPAVIGAGETLYKTWSKAQHLHINCLNRQVKVVR